MQLVFGLLKPGVAGQHPRHVRVHLERLDHALGLAPSDTPGIQLVEQVLAAQRLLGGGTTLAASGTVAGCAESLLHGTLRPNKYERITAHIAWYEHGLTHCTILFWYSRMTGRKGASRSLAVDTDALQLPIDFVLFHLGDIVTDIVDHRHVLSAGLAAKDAGEVLAHSIHQKLPVGPGKVCCTGHGCKIRLPLVRL